MIFIDFEYNTTANRTLNLVCAAIRKDNITTVYWLYRDPAAKTALAALLTQEPTVCCYNALAEGRAYISLGLNPRDFAWVDLMYCWKQAKNQNHRLQYGDILSKKHIPLHTTPPERTKDNDEETGVTHSGAGNSLVDCCYGLLKILIDSERKEMMRDIIISDLGIENNKEEISEYCASDVEFLPQIKNELFKILVTEYTHFAASVGNLLVFPRMSVKAPLLSQSDIEHHSRFVVNLATIEATGIPLNMSALKTLSHNYADACRTLIESFMFQSNCFIYFQHPKTKAYIEKQDKFDAVVTQYSLQDVWPRSDKTNKFKKDDATLESFGGKYPVFEALRQTKKSLQQLKWYRPNALPEFLERVGEDKRLRCYFNPYGTQTGRNAPPAKTFIFAQSSWLRCMIQPPKGRVIIAADWKSQEFALSAARSGDNNMWGAYQSGDVYVAYGQAAGLFSGTYDKDNTEHRRIRNAICKPVVLGISYGMGAASLASKIDVDVRTAQQYIDLFYHNYATFARYKRAVNFAYFKQGKVLRSMDNWLLCRDNKNTTSVLNFPIQSAGASCLRYAIDAALDAGLTVISPLHDAIYFECDANQTAPTIEIIKRVMQTGVDKATQNTKYLIPVDISVHTHEEIWVEEKGRNIFNLLGKFAGLK